MKNWFEVQVKYQKVNENGKDVKVTETYLLDAVSFTEAEARIYKEMEKVISGEFTVMKISRTSYAELILENSGDRYFKGKVTFITFDEENGKEKRVTQTVLVYAESVQDADKFIKEAMKGMMADFEISAIIETKIMDVFPYVEQ